LKNPGINYLVVPNFEFFDFAEAVYCDVPHVPSEFFEENSCLAN
jgi:hypothetical protein